ncbi:hypothetical protein [Thomasclavelia cocleata]|jgi:hypothetical protein|uniref:hypothetical protein n=1 Tax=Thomasclavelia cocleata TaxID=69824 RepID=UPI00242C0C93|nr:hypothetical protein [Thomasclavelia cocleata]
MKKYKNLFVTVISVLLTIMNISPVLGVENNSEYPTLRELVISGEIDLKEMVMPEEYSLNEFVAATVSIYASSSGSSSLSTSGHAWIVIREKRAARTYGNYRVSNGNSITMGTWGNKGYDGIWYNLESKLRTSFSPSSTVYLKTAVMGDQINTFTNALPNLNSWSLTNNCTGFAIKAWSKTGAPLIASVTTPTALRDNIKKVSGYKTGISDSDFVDAATDTRHY